MSTQLELNLPSPDDDEGEEIEAMQRGQPHRFVDQISLGNILSLITIVVSGIGGVWYLSNFVASASIEIHTLEQTIKEWKIDETHQMNDLVTRLSEEARVREKNNDELRAATERLNTRLDELTRQRRGDATPLPQFNRFPTAVP